MAFLILLQSLVIILAPLYIIRFHLFIPTTFLEVLLLVTLFVSFIVFFKDGTKFSNLRTKFDVLIILFLVSTALATFKSYDIPGGLGILKAYFLEPVLFFYSLIFTSRKKGYNFIIVSLLITGLWLSLLGVLQKITGSFSLAPYELLQGRVSALYNSANSLALFLGPIAILVISLFITVKNETQKLLFLLLFLLFTIIIILTRSRGGMISEVGALSIIAYCLFTVRYKILSRIWYVIPIICTGIILLFLYSFYQNYNFLPVNDGKPYTAGDTLQIRYFIWAGTVTMLQEHPIFGAGLNGFKTLYSNQYRLPQFQEQFQYPHNLLLTFWTETGILGLFTFLVLFVSAISLIIRKLLQSRYIFIGAGLLGMLSYIFIHGIIDVPYFKNDLSVEFWVILALIQLWSEDIKVNI